MANERLSPLAWSFALRRCMEECKRAYYYRRFWSQRPAERRKRLWEMSHLKTVPMLRGEVVHLAIANALKQAERGEVPGIGQVGDEALSLIRCKVSESKSEMWRDGMLPPGKRASEVTILSEHYYGCPEDTLRIRVAEAEECVTSALGVLLASELWARLVRGLCARKWSLIERANELGEFHIGTAPARIKVDMAANLGDGPTLIDWKTGAPSDDDRQQLLVYALYAQEKWHWAPSQVRLYAVYLLNSEPKVQRVEPEAGELEELRESICRQYAEMEALESAGCAGAEDSFPQSGGVQCQRCSFRAACGVQPSVWEREARQRGGVRSPTE